MLHTSSTRTRREWCCLRLYYKIFFIYRTCMRRTPARPVRALCKPVARLLSKNMTCARPWCNATPSKHFLHTSHCTLHTPHFALALHSPHFISSQIMWTLLNSSHLISSPLISSHMSSRQVLLNCFHPIRALINLAHLLKVFLNSSQLFCRQESSYCQREVSCTKNIGRRKLLLLHTDLETQLHLHRKAFTKYFLLQSLRKACTSTTLCYKFCMLHVPALLCTTKFAQALPRTTLHYRACTKHVPVLLCTTMLAQTTSQY